VKAEYINPFIAAVNNIFPQLGFEEIRKKNVSVKKNNVERSGILMMLGIVGDIEGNIAYYLSFEDAKKIAAKMMMQEDLEELNDIAKSALSELSNMLTANASINLSQKNINVDITTPSTLFGQSFSLDMNTDSFISIEMIVDDMLIDINIAIK
jgi:chemotaxis protein CheX